MYNDKIGILIRELITTITNFIIPVDLCQNNEHVINFTTDDMISKSEYFSRKKMDAIYPTEIMIT